MKVIIMLVALIANSYASDPVVKCPSPKSKQQVLREGVDKTWEINFFRRLCEKKGGEPIEIVKCVKELGAVK